MFPGLIYAAISSIFYFAYKLKTNQRRMQTADASCNTVESGSIWRSTSGQSATKRRASKSTGATSSHSETETKASNQNFLDFQIYKSTKGSDVYGKMMVLKSTTFVLF